MPIVDWPDLWRARVVDRLLGRGGRPVGGRRRWLVLATVLTGLFATGFSITVLAVSIGEIADDLGASKTTVSWAVTGPLLALAISMPLFGKIGDLRGHRKVYLAGLAGFTVLTLLTAFAWSAGSLVALRVAGALAGGATGPTSMALIMHQFPERERVKAMGWWSLVGAGAPVFGVVLGGPLVDLFGWRAIFLLQAPLAAAALVLSAFVLDETPRRPREAVDYAGAGWLAVSTVSLLLALSQARVWGWDSLATLALLVLSPAALLVFVRTEHRAVSPLLPLGLFGRRNFAPSLVAQFASNFAYMGGFFITPILMQDIFGWGLATTGYLMLCRPLTFSLSSPAWGYLTTRTGERFAAVVGTGLVAISMCVFALAASTESVPLVLLALLCSGLGLGASSPSLIASVANAVDESDLGVANAAQAMVAQVGVSIGIQVMLVLQSAGTGTGSFAIAYLAGAVVAGGGVAAAAFVRSLPRGAIRERPSRPGSPSASPDSAADRQPATP